MYNTYEIHFEWSIDGPWRFYDTSSSSHTLKEARAVSNVVWQIFFSSGAIDDALNQSFIGIKLNLTHHFQPSVFSVFTSNF